MNRKTSQIGAPTSATVQDSTAQRSVDRAAEQLVASGVRPTVQRIHDIVGGSARKVGPMLEDWRKRLSSRFAADQDGPGATASDDETAEAFIRRAIDDARHAISRRGRSARNGMGVKIHLRNAADPAELRVAYKRAEQSIVELRAKESACHDKLRRLHDLLATMELRAASLAAALRQLDAATKNK